MTDKLLLVFCPHLLDVRIVPVGGGTEKVDQAPANGGGSRRVDKNAPLHLSPWRVRTRRAGRSIVSTEIPMAFQ